MRMHGLRVTLQPPDGTPFVEDAILTLATGVNGGQLYSGNNGFWIEVVDAADGTHDVAGFGWQDGKRGHTIVETAPIIL
ncbi:hypothetical protein ABH926_003863 [Catenulispora sp. GP43]|uniref:hypothetical protein n=1 Tax=Catenulispora sp. GP43 TaxID=3156263 RepID=UPI003514C92B